ncbi:MAG: MraZ N-terminal domain containing protein, partial [Peptococcaceae bacterium]|nr:MraZ N-terminal domain containing protein [Peptococcaceae bacterium]
MGAAPTSFDSEHQHNFDERGRLILPVRLRDGLGSRCILSKGIEECIDVYPLEAWAKLEEKLDEFNDFTRSNRDFKRRF